MMSDEQDSREFLVLPDGTRSKIVTLEELMYTEHARLKARLAREMYQVREHMAPQRREVHRLRSLSNYFKRRLETEDTPEVRERAAQAETLFLEASQTLAMMANDYDTDLAPLRRDVRLAWRKLFSYGLTKPRTKRT
jgi:uncharacterized protein YeeX (DUF496 family)